MVGCHLHNRNCEDPVREIEAYVITCLPEMRQYIGITSQGCAKRWSDHSSAAVRLGGGKSRALYDSIAKFGKSAFTIMHIASATNWADAWKLERALIRQTKTMWPDGYNLFDGGGPGANHSDVSRARLSRSIRLKHADPNYVMRRRVALKIAMNRPETRAKMRAILKRRPKRTPAQIAKLSNAATAIWTPEYRAKFSAERTGRKMPPGHGAKISAKNKGQKRTPEQCARISAGKKGVKLSDSHRRAIGLASLGRKRTEHSRALQSVRMRALRSTTRPSNVTLNDTQVSEIRTMIKDGAKNCDIAGLFCVNPSLISDIRRGHTYKPLTGNALAK